MKTLRHLFTAVLLLCSVAASAHGFEVDGIYYKITNLTTKEVAVTYKGNSSGEYSDEYTGNVVIPESVSVNLWYWVSDNHTDGSVTEKVLPFTVEADGLLSFDWSVSSESNYDWLTITLDGEQIVRSSGSNSGTFSRTFEISGEHQLTFSYSKDNSQSNGDDAAKVLNLTLSNGSLGEEVEAEFFSVTGIAVDAFSGCSGLTSVEIPNSVTSIGSSAFYNCSSLASVEIGNSVTSIGEYAFSGCSGLVSIEIPNSVTDIKVYAFVGCTLLKELRIEDGDATLSMGRAQQSYGNRSNLFNDSPLESVYLGRNLSYDVSSSAFRSPFNDKSTLTTVIIGNNVTNIGEFAFSGCSGLTSIVIPNSVTSIGNYAFNGCTSLKELRIEDGEGTLSLGYNSSNGSSSKGLFRDCPLETLYLGRNLSYSTNNSSMAPFYGIETLTSVTIGDSVTSIGDYAFYNCTGLTSIEIPNSVTSIGSYAFYGCTGLASIEIPNSVTSIGDYAFNGCISLKELRIEDGEGTLSLGYNSYNSKGLFRDCPLETLYLGRNLSYSTNNSYYAPFYGIETLKSVVIGDSVTSIGSYAFYGCSGLTSIEIPNNVTNIGNYAFYNCTGLTSIEIPNSVTSIGESAFRGCTSLASVVIGDGVETIGGSAFYGCTSLASVEIGNSVTSIGSCAFYNCTGLTSVEIPNSVTSIGSSAFYGCTGLTSVEIPNSVTSIGSSAFYNCTGLTSVTIGNSVTSIGSSAFQNCTGLTSIVIPNSVTSIGYSAFRGCSHITSVTLGNGINEIGSEAFEGCVAISEVHISDLSAWCKIYFSTAYSSPAWYSKNLWVNGELLTDVVIPDDITEVKRYSFNELNIKSIVFNENITVIGYSAFGTCPALSGKVVIPNSVVTIEDYAFHNCPKITDFEIGTGVKSIGSYSFTYCSALKNVYISDLSAYLNIEFGTGEDASPFYRAENLYLNGELVTELIIPEGVSEIIPQYFKNIKSARSIVIPNSVKHFAKYALSNVNAILEFTAAEPAVLGGSVFHSNAVLAVPDAAVDAYKAAWSGYEAQIVGANNAVVTVDVEAEGATSGVMESIGIDKMGSIAKLTVKGSINSYDVIQFRDKMPLLRELDLSEATVVASDKAFYNGNCTKDNNLGAYAFYNLSKLNYVKLPKDLVAVGNNMFENCSSLRELQVPDSVQGIGSCAFRNCSALRKIEMPKVMASIGTAAFYNCSSLEEITIPDGVKSLPDDWSYGILGNCSALKKVTLPNGLESIGSYAFDYCSALKEIKLPPTVKTINQYAFRACSSLEEIRIPSSVQSIGNNAFSSCSKLNKVYTYTVEPTAIQENTFSTFATATLYVPSFSFNNYYWDDGWKRFLNLAQFDEPYEYFYVNNDYVLNDDTGYIEGADGNAPDADINAGGGFVVEGEQGDDEEPNQNLGDVNVGSNGEGTSGSIIGDNNLHIDDLHIKITVKGGRWYFFAFPFDIKFKDISMQNGSDYVFRYYDGEERAKKGNGGWKDVNEDHLKAARGYIFQCSANDVLILNIEDVKFKKEDKYNELVAHVSENLKDASWNFTGNPYLSYYDLADMDYTAPVTVWDGSKYVAIRPGDDDYHFAPYEAFFVQKPEEQEAVGFNGDDQMTQNQSENKKEKQAAARRARGINPERLLINIVLSNGTSDDRTRIVFNENQSLAYETACDASKFETAGVAQLYTIGGNVHYAINERPADNGRVTLGYTAPAPGFYTVEAQRMDAVVYIKDFKTGTLHNLADGAYSFSTDAGTFNERFEIQLAGKAPGTTGIEDVDAENGEVKAEIYDLQGRKMKDAGKGIYIVNGEKVVK